MVAVATTQPAAAVCADPRGDQRHLHRRRGAVDRGVDHVGGVGPAQDGCILADADSDGQHIATLLCALFLRHFRPLVLAGHVYVAMPPLYRIDYGKNVEYALDDAERNGILERIRTENARAKPSVTRFKGLGEMNPLQLRETTMARETRRLVQLTVDAADNADQLMDMLLAKKRASDRRDWLETKGNLASVIADLDPTSAIAAEAADPMAAEQR
mgnify:CR=1 FL=1